MLFTIYFLCYCLLVMDLSIKDLFSNQMSGAMETGSALGEVARPRILKLLPTSPLEVSAPPLEKNSYVSMLDI